MSKLSATQLLVATHTYLFWMGLLCSKTFYSLSFPENMKRERRVKNYFKTQFQ